MGLDGLLLGLTSCEMVGDISESVGALFRQPLRDAGGGPQYWRTMGDRRDLVLA